METKTHIQHSLKWKKDQYPLMTKEYQRLGDKKNGIFLHEVCSVFEAYLERQQGKEKFTISSSEFRKILQEEIQKLELISKKTRKILKKKETETLQPQEQEDLGQNLEGWLS